jgi:hypothetical protein
MRARFSGRFSEPRKELSMFRSAVFGALALVLLQSPAFASGSIGGGAPRAEKRAYSEGKQLYLKQIACDSCVMPGGVTTAEQAQGLIEKLKNDYANLSEKQRQRVTSYLQRRFKI